MLNPSSTLLKVYGRTFQPAWDADKDMNVRYMLRKEMLGCYQQDLVAAERVKLIHKLERRA